LSVPVLGTPRRSDAAVSAAAEKAPASVTDDRPAASRPAVAAERLAGPRASVERAGELSLNRMPGNGTVSPRSGSRDGAPAAKASLSGLAKTVQKSAPGRALSSFFDVSKRRGASALPVNAADPTTTESILGSRKAAELSRLRQIKRVLGDGTYNERGEIVTPFGFRNPDGSHRMAYGGGLEGFLFTKLEQERDHGAEHALGQLEDYFKYLDALLAPMDWTLGARRDLRSLRYLAIDPAAKNERLNALVRDLAADWREEVKQLEPALWGRDASVYMILARAYNKLQEGKNFFDSIDDAELDRIAAETPANTLWLLDIFEIGEIRRWGTGGGSPYAIKGYHVKKELGGDAAFKRLVDRAHAKGLRVVADYIPNHTSLDSDMINERPEGFIHLVPPQPNPGEPFEAYRDRIMAEVPKAPWGDPMYYLVKTPAYPERGRRVEKYVLVHHPYQGGGFPILWVDMAQIDYSHPAAREYRLAEARDLFERTGIDGVRRDMSYFVLNDRFFRHWLGTLRWERDRSGGWVREELKKAVTGLEERKRDVKGREYLDELLETVRAVNPAAFHFDEAYEEFDALSRAGTHARYNKTGLFDALGERNADWVRGALRELAFRKWQLGAAGLVNFPITHDADDTHGGHGYAVDRYGKTLEATLALTLGLRPNLVYNGIEQGVSQRELLISDHFGRSQDMNKPIPFDIPVKIDWSKQNPERKAFVRRLARFTEAASDLLLDGVMDVPNPFGRTSIVAYTAAKYDAHATPSADKASGAARVENGRRAVMVAANLAEHEAWGHFQMDGAATDVLGAFKPRAGKSYRFIDRNDGDRVYTYSGRRLIAEGMFVKLGAGEVHLFEIEEFDTPPGESAARSAKTFSEPSQVSNGASAFGALRNAADALAVRLSIEAGDSAGRTPERRPSFSSRWDAWTSRLTNLAFLAFVPLQLPQIIANIGFISAGTLAPISILPWMGYSTGILANMILLSYFVGKKEKGAALVQAVGVLTSAAVVGQIFYAGFMPAFAFWSVAAAILGGLTLNLLHYRGALNEKLWTGWKELTGMAGLVVLPLVFTATFLPSVSYWPAAATAGVGALYIALKRSGRLPDNLKGMWTKLSAWTATLLFMFGPLAQISSNLADPANIAGLSLLTVILATVGNGLMIPRAVHTKDRIWFTGSAWAVVMGGLGVMATMALHGYLSPWFFVSAVAALSAWFAGSFLGSRLARK
jgi:glycosidase